MRKLIPQVRFPEFTREWEEKKLGDVGDVKMCKRIFNDDTSIEGDIPFYKIGSFGKLADAFITREKYLDFRKKYSFPSKGDILISAAGTIGRTVVYNGEDAYYQDSNIVWISNDYQTISNEFLFYVYQIVKYNTEGGTIQRLYNNILKSTKFSCPSLPEQTKIANFLTAVDEKLTALNQKKILLEQYKKGVMQQIFAQELRFKDDNGNDYADWEENKLQIYLEEFKENSVVDDQFEVLTSSNKGLMKQSDYFGENRLTNRENIGFNIIPDGYLTYRSRSDNRKFSFNENKLGITGLISTYYPVFRMKNSANNFFIELTNHFQNHIGKFSVGTSQTVLSYNQLKTIKFKFPCNDEQTKIANFLSAIDVKINHCQEQIDQTTIWKKGLLQQLFV
ncbi:restriction endonuclease subunit S [Flavobacterium sp.]|uniref:restriction endonuclease subunit S n=1 Tax=Flavobacterium sp. TaxID=239 RepID=UPI00261AC89F|nr:restriction endonuclease subunit S [Flavobacterium sp.]MDG2433799.1 restriction endonuclease subunit S [Flavobacterium sp.]